MGERYIVSRRMRADLDLGTPAVPKETAVRKSPDGKGKLIDLGTATFSDRDRETLRHVSAEMPIRPQSSGRRGILESGS